jgi:hypothetical protein
LGDKIHWVPPKDRFVTQISFIKYDGYLRKGIFLISISCLGVRICSIHYNNTTSASHPENPSPIIGVVLKLAKTFDVRLDELLKDTS